MIESQRFKTYFYLFLEASLATLAMMLPSILNKFPLIYYDSAYYLYFANAFEASPVLLYRPLPYSGLLHILNSTLGIIFVQTFLLSLALVSLLRKFELSQVQRGLGLLILVLTSPLLIITNTLMPDIYTAIQILSALLVIHKKTRRKERLFWGTIFLTTSLFHYSNLLTALGLGILFFFRQFRRTFRFQFHIRTQILAALALVMLLTTLPFIHARYWARPQWTDAAELMLFSRLTAFNIALEYLEKACDTGSDVAPYKLCTVPQEGFNLWSTDPQSNINRAGGLNALRSEIKILNREILKTPHLLLKFLRKSSANIFRQFFSFQYELSPVLDDPTTLVNLQHWQATEATKYQSQSLLKWDRSAFELWRNKMEIYLSLWSYISVLLLFLWGLRHWPQNEKSYDVWEHRRLLKMWLLFHTIISIVCGALTEPHSRYSSRYLFVGGFVLILIIFQSYNRKKSKISFLTND